jgi:putative flippase GtrA
VGTAFLRADRILRTWSPVLIANFVALTVTTVLNTEANRRFTFTRAGGSTGRVHLQGLVVFGLYYLFTSGTLLALNAFDPHASRALELVVLLASSVVGTAARFALLRAWVFTSNTTRGRA